MITKDGKQDEKLRKILERLEALEFAVGNGDENSVKGVFKAVESLGLALKPMIDLGFAEVATTTNSNPISQFIKRNYGFAKTLPDGSVEIDYSKIIVSEGVGKGLLRPSVEVDEMGNVSLDWSTVDLTQDDVNTVCYFCVLCPTANKNVEPLAVFQLGKVKTPSGDAKINVTGAWGWSDQKIYVYGFTMKDNEVVSSSQFLGEFIID